MSESFEQKFKRVPLTAAPAELSRDIDNYAIEGAYLYAHRPKRAP